MAGRVHVVVVFDYATVKNAHLEFDMNTADQATSQTILDAAKTWVTNSGGVNVNGRAEWIPDQVSLT